MQDLKKKSAVRTVDPVWEAVRDEAKTIIDKDPLLSNFVYATVLNQNSLEEAIAYRISELLHSTDVSAEKLRVAFAQMAQEDKSWSEIVRTDIAAVYDRDPACDRLIVPILYFKGFQAIQTHRLAHWNLKQGRKDFALYLQSRSSQIFQLDINPAASFGKGLFIDHATGVVVGETAVVGDDCSIMHNVTLGGTGKQLENRHPKIGNGVLIGAGAKILGNIKIGDCSRVAAGSMVIKPVDPKVTVAGVPAKEVGVAGCSEPSRTMNQILAEDMGI